MKILVFDDTRKHRDAAWILLKGHELTVVGTYDEAEDLLMRSPNFDVVMTDLMVPASSHEQGAEGWHFVGQEMPLGSIIALLALAEGVKKVAVVTDTNHHHHPASAALDCFNRVGGSGDVRIFCTNNALVPIDEQTMEAVDKNYPFSSEGQEKYPARADHTRKGLFWAKDWKKVLDALLSEVEDGK